LLPLDLGYVEPVFRPPSEWKSLILQVANGCSHNACTFCEMYTAPQKKFRPKAQDRIREELEAVARSGHPIQRIFLADGDAMTLSVKRLRTILQAIRECLPSVRRVSSYCLPANLKKKSVDELSELRELGLKMVYVGCESGDDHVLQLVNKGETYISSAQALEKLAGAGIKRSVMILNGLGGTRFSEQHAIHSAQLMNAAQPEYLSTLVVSFPQGMQRFQDGFKGQYEPLNQVGLFREMELLLDGLDLRQTIFRSDHASNYLVLKGTLGKDKPRLLETVRAALSRPKTVPLRQEWQRGL